MSSKNIIPCVDVEELVNTSVQTVFGLRDVRFFWGDLGKVVKPDSVVVISTNRFRRPYGEVGGQGWRSLCNRFPGLESQKCLFEEVITAGENSHHWKLDKEELEQIKRYDETKVPRPAILVSGPGNSDQFERIFVVRHSYHSSRANDINKLKIKYERALKACFPAIKSVEAEKLSNAQGTQSLYGNIILSTLINPERFNGDKKAIFHALYDAAKSWLQASPMWKSVDIVCRFEGLSTEEAKSEVKNLLGEERLNLDSQNLKNLFQVNLDNLNKAIRMLEDPQSQRNKNEIDKSLLEEMRKLRDKFTPYIERKTLDDFGNSTRIFTETLVMWFIREFFPKSMAIKDNKGGNLSLNQLLETIKKRSEECHHASSWFLKYLESLQILGNKASHSKDADDHRFPKDLQEEDMLVLLSCLKRVLDFQISWLEK